MNTVATPQTATPPRLNRGRSMLRMAGAWTVLGVLTGVATALPFRAGTADVVSKAIAGALVYSLMGTAIGLLASRAQESIIGGLFGMIVGLAAQLWQPATPPGQCASVCLTIGALIGATCWPWVQIVRTICQYVSRLLLGRPAAG